MTSIPTFLEISTPFSLCDASTLLARFVRDPYRPCDNFAPDPPPKLLEDKDSYQIMQESVESFNTKNNKQSGSLLIVTLTDQTGRTRKMQAEKVSTCRLKQHDRVFERVLAEAGVRAGVLHLMSGTDNGKLYMVVGFKTCVNASVKMEVKRTLSSAGTISPLPLGFGGPAGVTNESNKEYSDSYTVGEKDKEIVFAIEYKVVRDKKGLYNQRNKGLRLGRNVSSGGMFGDESEEDEDSDSDEDSDEDLQLLQRGLGANDISRSEKLLF